MPQRIPIFNSFEAGELSPLTRGRSDLEVYQKGLDELTNIIPDARGGAIGRKGSRWLQQSEEGSDARVISIPVNDNFFYSAIFLDKSLTISSIIGHSPNASLAENPNFNNRGTGWAAADDGNQTSSVVFEEGVAILSIQDFQNRFAYITQQITGLTANETYSFLWDVRGTTDGRVKVGTAANLSDLFEQDTTIAQSTADVDIGPNTSIWITTEIASINITENTSLEVNYLGFGEVSDGGVTFDTPYEEFELKDLHGVFSASGRSVYILHENYPPYSLTYNRSTDTFDFELVTFTSPPIEWKTGNYPATGTVFEGRLWLAGTKNEPQTFWGSKSGVYNDFTQGALADDGLQFTIAQYGRIRWMVGFKNLIIGTQNGEQIVTSDGGIITPSDIQISQQSAYGSNKVQPVQVGDQIFYVSADSRKVRAIQYEWQADNWLSKDLTFSSEHITRSGIRHVAWQQNPANLFHCVLNDGTTATMTYTRTTNSYGWCRYETQGEFLDFAVGALNGTDYVNGAVLRNGVIVFETQPSTSIENYYLDSWGEYLTEPDNVTVIGLERFEGLTVSILGDGAVQPDRIVTGGQITLQTPATIAVVGLNYSQKLVTLPLDKGEQNGSAAAYTKRWSKIYLRLLNSGQPMINGVRPPVRTPSTPMNTRQPNTTDDIEVVGLNYDRDAIITVEETLPVPLTVLSIYGKNTSSIT